MLVELAGGPLDGEYVEVNLHSQGTVLTIAYEAQTLRVDPPKGLYPKHENKLRYAEYRLSTCDDIARLVFIRQFGAKAKPK